MDLVKKLNNKIINQDHIFNSKYMENNKQVNESENNVSISQEMMKPLLIIASDSLEIKQSIEEQYKDKDVQLQILNDEDVFSVLRYLDKKAEDLDERIRLNNWLANEENKMNATRLATRISDNTKSNLGWFNIERLVKRLKWKKQQCEEIITTLLLFGFCAKDSERDDFFKIVLNEDQTIEYHNYEIEKLKMKMKVHENLKNESIAKKKLI